MSEYKPLMQCLLEAGVKREDMDHRECASDLYVRKTPVTEAVIKDWCQANGFAMSLHAPSFVSQIDGRIWYDCAFQYLPFWEKVAAYSERQQAAKEAKAARDKLHEEISLAAIELLKVSFGQLADAVWGIIEGDVCARLNDSVEKNKVADVMGAVLLDRFNVKM